MSVNQLTAPTQPVVIYPDSDGKPMADNTKQFRWITVIATGLEAVFADDPQVFVAGDLLWYPVEGDNKTRIAPDALVAFGRPKGDRGSYKQWEEEGIAPQVVFEVLSPGNTKAEMAQKLAFYDHYGVEEYYLYDPDSGRLQGWRRQGGQLLEIVPMRGWVSPRLGVRFDLEGLDLCLTGPDGRRFATYHEVVAQLVQVEQQAAQEAERAAQEAQRAAQEAQRATAAEQQARQEAQRANTAEQRAREQAQRASTAEQRARQQAQEIATAKQQAAQAAQRAEAAEAELARLRALLKAQGLE